MINHKPPVRVKDNDSQRVIDHLYQVINELQNSVNVAQKGQSPDTQGKAGDLRTVKNRSGESVLEVKTEEGFGTIPITLSNTR